MPIAAVLSDASTSAGLVLTKVARHLQRKGCRLAGAVQTTDPQEARQGTCVMTLSVLPDGPELPIWQELGQHARGCRLDHEALEDVVGLVDRAIESTTDVLIINKFGKREGEGAGFRQTIARAIDLNIPVLVGINEAERQTFESFVGGAGHVLPARLDDVLLWYDRAST
ncbi:MAG: DUF2478 domain-containing protein [Pseudomonadota bacterium]